MWFLSPGCTPEMGASDNFEETGRQDRGRDPGEYNSEVTWDPEEGDYVWNYDLFYSDVILSPDGRRLLSMVPVPKADELFHSPALVLVAQDLPGGRMQSFPKLKNLRRINFSPDGETAYLLKEHGLDLAVLDLNKFDIVDTLSLQISTAGYSGSYDYPGDPSYNVVDISPDGGFAVLSNLPTSDLEEDAFGVNCKGLNGFDRCAVGFVDLVSKESWATHLDLPLRDLDFDVKEGGLIFTHSMGGQQAKVTFYDLAARELTASTTFNNCADEMVVEKSRNIGLVSPRWCSKDPISIVNLESRKFVKNLPGFGPVVVSRDGSTAVGFTRKNVMESEWQYYDQTAAYGLIIVDLDTLEWRVLDYGEVAPSYTVSPDGRYLYVYEHEYDYNYQENQGWETTTMPTNFTQIDLVTLQQTKLSDTPTLLLDRFVWSDDGNRMYLLSDKDLYYIDKGIPAAHKLPLPVQPELMNLRPQQDFLLLGESDAPMYYLFDVAAGGLDGALSLKY